MLAFRKAIATIAIYSMCFFNCFTLYITFIVPPNMAQAEMPWEAPLCKLEKSLTGSTAKSIAMIGLFVAGGLLVFGGDLADFARRITWMCLAISVMISGSSFIDMIGGSENSC
jgi:type IV secretion system protein TrbC